MKYVTSGAVVQPINPYNINNELNGFVPIINPKEFGSQPISIYYPSCRQPIQQLPQKNVIFALAAFVVAASNNGY